MKIRICFLLLVLISQTYAQEIKAHKTQQPINIDGFISDSEWNTEFFQSKFIQLEPAKGKLSREITKVAVQYDEKNIYVAFICQKSYPDPLVAEETRRDQIVKRDDAVAVILDTYHDHRSAFWFMINGLNTQTDVRISDDGKYLDVEWDTGWEAKTAVSDSGYTVEFAIPFKSICFNPELNLLIIFPI